MMLHPTKYGHEAIRDRYLEAMEGTRASRIPTNELVVTVDRLAIDNQSPELTLGAALLLAKLEARSEEHTSELPSLMRIAYAVFFLNKTHTLRLLHRYDTESATLHTLR